MSSWRAWAVGNLSKFTRESSRRNADVADTNILAASLEYVGDDIEVLKPSIVLVAKPVSDVLATMIGRWTSAAGGGRTIRTYQYHPRTFAACRRKFEKLSEPERVAAENLVRRRWEAVAPMLKSYEYDRGSRLAYFLLLAHEYARSGSSPSIR